MNQTIVVIRREKIVLSLNMELNGTMSHAIIGYFTYANFNLHGVIYIWHIISILQIYTSAENTNNQMGDHSISLRLVKKNGNLNYLCNFIFFFFKHVWYCCAWKKFNLCIKRAIANSYRAMWTWLKRS